MSVFSNMSFYYILFYISIKSVLICAYDYDDELILRDPSYDLEPFGKRSRWDGGLELPANSINEKAYFIARLLTKPSSTIECHASLVKDDMMVTAASCPVLSKEFEIHFLNDKDPRKKSNDKVFKIADMELLGVSQAPDDIYPYPHPNTPDLQYIYMDDLVAIKLDPPLDAREYKTNIKPIEITERKYEECYVIGKHTKQYKEFAVENGIRYEVTNPRYFYSEYNYIITIPRADFFKLDDIVNILDKLKRNQKIDYNLKRVTITKGKKGPKFGNHGVPLVCGGKLYAILSLYGSVPSYGDIRIWTRISDYREILDIDLFESEREGKNQPFILDVHHFRMFTPQEKYPLDYIEIPPRPKFHPHVHKKRSCCSKLLLFNKIVLWTYIILSFIFIDYI